MSEKPIKMNWGNLDLLMEALRAEFKMSKLHIFSWGFEKHQASDIPKPFIRCEKHNLVKKIYLDDAVNEDDEIIGWIEKAIQWEATEKEKYNSAAHVIASIFNDQFEKKVQMKSFVCCREDK